MIIVIVGPTAVGKTKLSVALAHLFNGEIINADSTQIYKGLDIATAKVTEEEKENIPHHLFDIKEIEENYTVYDYQRDCRQKIEEIQKRNHNVIIVGGTGLYIKAALYDYRFETETKTINYQNISTEELYERLQKLENHPPIHKNNRKRIERALTYYENHQSFPIEKKKDIPLYPFYLIGLTTARDKLYQKIDIRVDNMLKQGLLEEAKKVYESNIRTKAVITPIGYKELFPYFEKKESLENCIEKIKQNSRHYAKRQMTWFNNQMQVKWYHTNFEDFNQTINQIYQDIEKEC